MILILNGGAEENDWNISKPIRNVVISTNKLYKLYSKNYIFSGNCGLVVV
jgi:hypothetical protein